MITPSLPGENTTNGGLWCWEIWNLIGITPAFQATFFAGRLSRRSWCMMLRCPGACTLTMLPRGDGSPCPIFTCIPPPPLSGCQCHFKTVYRYNIKKKMLLLLIPFIYQGQSSAPDQLLQAKWRGICFWLFALHLMSNLPSSGWFKKLILLPTLKIGGSGGMRGGQAPSHVLDFVTSPPVFWLEAHVMFELSFGFAT